jgi:hypothetical protein
LFRISRYATIISQNPTLNDYRLCEYAVGSVLLTLLVAGLAAIILLGRRQKLGRMSDSAAALTHLLAGQSRPEEESTADGRALDGIFDERTADIQSDFRRAQEPYLRAQQTLNGSSGERLLDYAEVNAPQAAVLISPLDRLLLTQAQTNRR